jgi:signal transduction histidine kinase
VNRADIAQQLRAGFAALRRPTGTAPQPSRWAWVSDIVLAVVMTAATLTTSSRNVDGTMRRAPGPPLFDALNPPISVRHFPDSTAGFILALMTTLPLAFRRKYPRTAFWLILYGTRLFNPGQYAGDAAILTLLSCVIAGYGAAVYSPYRRASGLSILFGAIVILTHHDNLMPGIAPAVVPFLLLVPVVLGANAAGMWKQRAQTAEEKQETRTRLAVEQERARIAAELHDVVTHNVSVMVVQAGAARKVLDKSPELARDALLAVEAGGRAAMAELRHVMGLLTMTSEGPDGAVGPDLAGAVDLAPQPGLDQVPALAERIRDTGVQVGVQTLGTPAPLPSGVDLAAYRVVQEALTNTVKHAVGAQVVIRIAYAEDSVRIDVTDTGGTRSATAASGNGRGLIGLRERLAVYGGTLHAGSRLNGGYRVSAVIPVEGPR